MLPGLSIVHLAVIAVVALLVLGPDKLPELARRASHAYHDLQRLRAHLHVDLDDLLGEPVAVTAPPSRLPATEHASPLSIVRSDHEPPRNTRRRQRPPSNPVTAAIAPARDATHIQYPLRLGRRRQRAPERPAASPSRTLRSASRQP